MLLRIMYALSHDESRPLDKHTCAGVSSKKWAYFFCLHSFVNVYDTLVYVSNVLCIKHCISYRRYMYIDVLVCSQIDAVELAIVR